MKSDYWRQLNFYNPDNDRNSVLVIGAGALGSYVTFGLARMGVRDISVIDFDKVEAHNLPNQFFAESILEDGSEIFKVLALKKTIDFIVPNNTIRCFADDIKLSELNRRSWNVIFVTVDSMEVRQWIWNNMKDKTRLIIDGRIGGQFANVYTIVTGHFDASNYYNTQLPTDEEVDKIAPLPCSGRSVVDISMGVAGEMVGRYRHYVKGEILNMHSFHDYKIGQSAVFMAYTSLNQQRDLMDKDELVKAGIEPEQQKLSTIVEEMQNTPLAHIPIRDDMVDASEFPVEG